MSNLRNPPLGSDFGNREIRNPPLGPDVGSQVPQNQPVGPPLGRTGLQNLPVGPGMGLQPPIAPSLGSAGLQNSLVGHDVGGGLRNPPLEFVMRPQSQQYKGHRIELRERTDLELLIDDQPIRYGQLPDGSFALDEYAYDRSHDLIDVAKKFIDYRDRARSPGRT